MQTLNAPIGVMDSGVGGLSVVKALRTVLPGEDILYFGDTANCPYGNKSREELLSLSRNMLNFLQEKGVKCVALACNTTSSLADVLRKQFTTPIITVAECAADAIGRLGLRQVGVLATVATVHGGIYESRIRAVSPATAVCSVGSYHLARLVEEHSTEDSAIEQEIQGCMEKLLEQQNVDHVILGCTHYPLVKELFERLYPNICFMDPAPYQAVNVKSFLKEHALQKDTLTSPKLTIYTTGETEEFYRFCRQNELDRHYVLKIEKI